MIDFRLMVITGRHLCRSRSLEQTVLECCRAGVKAIQLREKDLPESEVKKLAAALKNITSGYGTKLIINSFPEVARQVNAEGVHCPEAGPSPESVKAVAPDMLVGQSIHPDTSVTGHLQKHVDYFVFGPVYHTPSKAKYGEPAGPDRLKQVITVCKKPVLAVGGIHPERAEQCLEYGASGVAVLSSVMQAENVYDTIRQYETHLNGL